MKLSEILRKKRDEEKNLYTQQAEENNRALDEMRKYQRSLSYWTDQRAIDLARFNRQITPLWNNVKDITSNIYNSYKYYKENPSENPVLNNIKDYFGNRKQAPQPMQAQNTSTWNKVQSISQNTVQPSANMTIPTTKGMEEKRNEQVKLEQEKSKDFKETIRQNSHIATQEERENTSVVDPKAYLKAQEYAKKMEKGDYSFLLEKAGNDIISGGQNAVGGVINAGASGLYYLAKVSGNEEIADNLANFMGDIYQKEKRANETRNVLHNEMLKRGKGGFINDLIQRGGDLTESIAQTLTVGAMSGGSGSTAPGGVSKFGNEFAKSLEENNGVDWERDFNKALIKGVLSSQIEKATGGTLETKKWGDIEATNTGWLDGKALKIMAKYIQNPATANTVNKVWSEFGEVAEEITEDLADALVDSIDKGTYEGKFNWDEFKKEFSKDFNWAKEGETTIMTLISTYIMGKFGLGASSFDERAKYYGLNEQQSQQLKDDVDQFIDNHNANFDQSSVNDVISSLMQKEGLDVDINAEIKNEERAESINDTLQNIYDENMQGKATPSKESDSYKTNIQSMINNIPMPDEVKAQIQPFLNSNASMNEEQYNSLKETIKKYAEADTQRQYDELKNNVSAQYDQIEAQIEQLDEIKPENRYDKDNQKYYAQQLNSEPLNDETLNNLLTLYPSNTNGNRKVDTWKQIATEYGKQMALEGRNFEDVRRSVVKSWQELLPYKHKMYSENGERVKAGFFNSQMWSKLAYDSYKETMTNQLNQQKQNIMNDYQTQFQEIEDNSKAIEMTIDNLKPQVQESQLSPEEVQRQKDLVEQFAKNRGVNVRYDAEAFNGSNEEAKIVDLGNGKREMVINPNADPDAILVKLATHEMFHDTIRTKPHDKLTQLVMDKLKQDSRYQEWRNSVSEAYQEQLQGLNEQQQNALLDEEMTAKYLGEYLGDEQFVQDLVNSAERSTVQRIMDWIDNRLQQLKNIVTGDKEAEYWRKVRENFEKAYNSKYQGKEGSYYAKNEYGVDLENNTYLDYNNNVRKLTSAMQEAYDTFGEEVEPFFKYNHTDDFYRKYDPQDMKIISRKVSDDGEANHNGYVYYDNATLYYKTDMNDARNFSVAKIIDDNPIKEEVLNEREINRDSGLFIQQKNEQRTSESNNQSVGYDTTNRHNDGLVKEKSQSDDLRNGTESTRNKRNIEKSLEQRVSGDELLNAKDLIEEIKSVGGKVDNKGYVTVYHQTNQENANKILKEGKMSAKEDGIFFSTSQNAQQSEGRGDAKLEFKIPAEKLVLDDIFDDNADVKIPLDNKNQVLDVSDYIVNNNTSKSQQGSFNLPKNKEIAHKEAQLKIVQETNPMWNDTSVGIRKVDDIQTFEECIKNADKDSAFVWGDYTKEDAQRDLKRGLVTIYSSYPIKNGVFVSTSYQQAYEYAGHDAGQVHQRTVKPDSVAWINGDEGQYAKVKTQPDASKVETQKIDNLVNNLTATKENINDTDIYSEARKQANREYKSINTDEEIDAYNQRVSEIENKIIAGLEQQGYININGNYTQKADTKLQKQTAFDEYLKESNPNRTGATIGDLNRLQSQQKLPTKQVNQPKAQQSETKEVQPIEKMKTIEEPTIKVVPSKTNTAEDQKIAKILSEPAKSVKPEQRLWAVFKTNFVDKGSVFEDLSFKTKNRELQAKWDTTLLAESMGQNAIGQDRYTFENGKETKVSKSLTSIIDEVGDNSVDFNNYMYHQLNIDRMTLQDRFGTANKPVFGDSIDANYSKEKVAQLEKAHPEFKQYAQDVYDYLDANKKELVDTGVISQETADKFKEMYPHYVPISRVDTKGQAINVPLDTNRTGVNSPIKRAKGGSSDIQPLFETIAQRTMQTYKAGTRNSFGLELKNSLDKLSMLNQQQQAIDTDTENIFEYDNDKEGVTEGTKYAPPTFTIFENGNKVTYDINQDMYDALKPKNELLSKLDNTKALKAMRAVSNFRRGIITEYNPVFSLTNSIKDAQDVLLNSQHATKTYSKFGEAYKQILNKGYWYKEYVQNGGQQNSYFTEGEFVKPDGKIKSKLKIPLDKISQVNNIIEMAPRLAEYIASREMGRSVQTSMLDASRVTTNFKAGGDVTKFANRNGATFLNASVQGLQQNIRNIREANAKGLKGYAVLLGKTAVASLPALLLNGLLWKDDDDYEELQDYVKNNYYVVAKIGDHKFLRIPKGRTVAVIQNLVDNIGDLINSKGELDADEYSKKFWKEMTETKDLAISNLAPNNPIDNNIFSPLVQAVKGKTWYGEDLIPSRLKDKPVEEQYDETTSEISKYISGLLNKIGVQSSPMQINYLIDQYGGGVADVVLPKTTPQAENGVIEDKFTTDSTMKSRYPGEFFDNLDELAVNRNSSKATPEDELKYKYANSVRAELSKLYQEKREIQNSDITDKEKKEKLAVVQKQINEKAKNALEAQKNVNITGDTATIGNQEYINKLNANTGEYSWEKVTENNKIKGVPLKTQADYENKCSQELIAKRKSGEISEQGKLSDKQKLEIISSSNYTDTQKRNLYTGTVGEKDTFYKDSEIDINEYLDYKISGVSKKADTLEYVNNNISGYENRLMIMGKNFKLSRSQQQDLASYIDTLPNADELFELLSKNFTVKNGTVYYK